MNRARLLSVTIVALALAVSLASVMPALGRSSFVTVVNGSGKHALLAPGTSTFRTLEVRNRLRSDGVLHVAARRVVDHENRCVAPEARVDRSCAHGGELSRWLVVTVSTAGPAGTRRTLWTGRLAELRRGVRVLGRIPRGATTRLRITASLPARAGNDTMTDRVTYDLRWTMTARYGSHYQDTRAAARSAG